MRRGPLNVHESLPAQGKALAGGDVDIDGSNYPDDCASKTEGSMMSPPHVGMTDARSFAN
jgi:hypothetical protein